MYRCTECNAEYEVCPDFCDCGNDTFEEVYSQVDDNYYEPAPAHKPKPRKLTPQEMEELREQELDKKKALITIGISAFISLIILLLPPYMPKKSAHVIKKAEQSNIKLPSVKSYWDDTYASPYRKKDPNWNLPILNKDFGNISPVLKEYLETVGQRFNREWDKALVKGSGECRVEFTINKEGNFGTKGISTRSYNESLDDSVLLLLSKINGFDIPPDDYKGERIIISFKVYDDGKSKVYFPTPKK